MGMEEDLDRAIFKAALVMEAIISTDFSDKVPFTLRPEVHSLCGGD